MVVIEHIFFSVILKSPRSIEHFNGRGPGPDLTNKADHDFIIVPIECSRMP